MREFFLSGSAIDSPSRIDSHTPLVKPLENRIARGLAGDVQGLQDGHAAGHQGAQGAEWCGR